MTDKMATCTLIVPFIYVIRKAYLIDVDMTLNPQWNTIETMFMAQFTSGDLVLNSWKIWNGT